MEHLTGEVQPFKHICYSTETFKAFLNITLLKNMQHDAIVASDVRKFASFEI